MLSFSASAQQPAFLTNALVAHYPFDGNATNIITGVPGLTIQVITCTNRFGSPNSAFQFDRNARSAVEVLDHGIPQGNPEFTTSFWIRQAARLVGDSVNYDLLYLSSNNSQNLAVGDLFYSFSLFNDWGVRPYLRYGRFALDEIAFAGYLLNPPNSQNLSWNHIVISTKTNSAASIYLNGNPLPWLNLPDTGKAGLIPSGSLKIGTSFSGQIDDFRIFNRALSDTEVAALYSYERNPPIRSAIATLEIANGFVIGSNVAYGGIGYTNAPNVTISGSGSGASAIATVANGRVTGISIISAGRGYDSGTTISIDPPPYPPSQATADATIANGKISTIIVSDGGHGYGTTIPPVTIIGGGGVGAKAVANMANGSVVSVTITAFGTAYTSAPTVLIAGPPGSPKASIVVKTVELGMELVSGYSYKIQTSYDGGFNWYDTGSAFLATSSVMNKVFSLTSPSQLFRIVQVN